MEQIWERCFNCDGDKFETCEDCDGAGEVEECAACKGMGCPTCSDRGVIPT